MHRTALLALVVLASCGGSDEPLPDPIEILDSGALACWIEVPAGIEAVGDTQSYFNDAGIVWACPGADVTVNSRDWIVFAEAGSFVRALGPEVTIYAHSGAELIVSGTDGLVVAEPGVTVTYNVDVDERTCAELRFDASKAGVACPGG